MWILPFFQNSANDVSENVDLSPVLDQGFSNLVSMKWNTDKNSFWNHLFLSGGNRLTGPWCPARCKASGSPACVGSCKQSSSGYDCHVYIEEMLLICFNHIFDHELSWVSHLFWCKMDDLSSHSCDFLIFIEFFIDFFILKGWSYYFYKVEIKPCATKHESIGNWSSGLDQA